MKKIWIPIIVVIIIITAVVVFYKPASKEAIKIGAILPLTGEAASYGQGGVAGIETAVKEINDKGGIKGRKIEVIYEDDKCDTKESVSVANKLINVDKVDVIVGGICSVAMASAVPVIEQSKTPMIITGASAPELTKNNDFIFRIYPSDNFQGKFVAEYIMNQMHKSKVAVIYLKNAWGQGIYNVSKKRFTELGGKVVFEDSVIPGSLDLKGLLVKMKEANPEIIYAPLQPTELLAGIKQAKELGIKTQFITGDFAETDQVIKSDIAEGLLYTVAAINNPEDFRQKVKAISGKDSNLITPMTYDAINIFAKVIEDMGTNKLEIQRALTKLNVSGISSPNISFDKDGDIKNPVFEVKIIKNKTSVKF